MSSSLARSASRKPPHALDAEAAILGAALLRPSSLDEVDLGGEAFYDPRHRAVYEAMLDLRARSVPIDPTTLTDALGDKSTAIGGDAFLSSLLSVTTTADNVRFYADRVRDTWRIRQVVIAASEIAAAGYDADDADAYTADAMQKLGALADLAVPDDATKTVGQIMASTLRGVAERAQALLQGKRLDDTMPTSIRAADDVLGGGWPVGKLSVLGGRPSDGKSSLIRGSVLAAALLGFGCHVFSMEDDHDVWGMRVLSDAARVPLRIIRTATERDLGRETVIRKERFLDLQRGADSVSGRPILVDRRAGLSSSRIAMSVRRHKAKNKTRFVVVDYAQLCEEPPFREMLDKVGAFTRGMVKLARDEGVAVVLLSQLNRANERESRPPRLHDLRETGELEQHARMVGFVYQERKEGAPTGKCEFLISKQSNGERDVSVPLKWDGATATYSDGWA